MFKKCLALAALFLGPTFMVCQVVPAARGGAPPLSAGGFISYYDAAYASNKPIGFGGFIDWSPYRNFGIEAEGRWLMFNTDNDFREYTYLAGPALRIPPRQENPTLRQRFAGWRCHRFSLRPGIWQILRNCARWWRRLSIKSSLADKGGLRVSNLARRPGHSRHPQQRLEAEWSQRWFCIPLLLTEMFGRIVSCNEGEQN